MISRLKLMDFRCYGSFSWQIPQQGAIILGNNARGKTSLLEAVCFLLRLQSPRTVRTGPLVSHGKQSFGIRGELPGQIRRILWAPDAPDLRVNGEPRKDQRSYLADSYPVVWMGNDDLSLVQAGADARRKYMDFLGSQWHPGYRLALFSYRRALKTRNYLLKHRHRDKLQLDAYTRQLALHGTELRNLRANLLALLAPHIALAYRNIGGRQEQVSIAYRASEEGDLYERLCASMDRDIRYGQTQNGPHRDDLDITLNGRNAAQFASEGQQRTTAISMKLAQSSLLTEETGHTPIHLIDDVFGELDPTRRIAFCSRFQRTRRASSPPPIWTGCTMLRAPCQPSGWRMAPLPPSEKARTETTNRRPPAAFPGRYSFTHTFRISTIYILWKSPAAYHSGTIDLSRKASGLRGSAYSLRHSSTRRASVKLTLPFSVTYGVRPEAATLSVSRPLVVPHTVRALWYSWLKKESVSSSPASIKRKVWRWGRITTNATGFFHMNPKPPQLAVIMLKCSGEPAVTSIQSSPINCTALS